MGGGTWTATSATNFVTTKYASLGATTLDSLRSFDVRQVYDSFTLDAALNPKNVIRECVDSEEHPDTFPIILALDVTGSMGNAAKACASKLNEIMENLYSKVKDVEFLMMGIGDLAYDTYPIQATQFESDVRILDQATKIYFEGGGGGNAYESYTAAWYFGLHNTKLDCWKRGKKGIIITMGDEGLNPYLPGNKLANTLGAVTQDVDTQQLYEDVQEKFDVYHIAITDSPSFAQYETRIKNSFGKLLNQHCLFGKSDDLPDLIGEIINAHLNDGVFVAPAEGIAW